MILKLKLTESNMGIKLIIRSDKQCNKENNIKQSFRVENGCDIGFPECRQLFGYTFVSLLTIEKKNNKKTSISRQLNHC